MPVRAEYCSPEIMCLADASSWGQGKRDPSLHQQVPEISSAGDLFLWQSAQTLQRKPVVQADSLSMLTVRCAGYPEMTSLAYFASSTACIGAIACLSQQQTARVGNALGMVGVSGGVAATMGALGADAAVYTQIAGVPLALTISSVCSL